MSYRCPLHPLHNRRADAVAPDAYVILENRDLKTGPKNVVFQYA